MRKSDNWPISTELLADFSCFNPYKVRSFKKRAVDFFPFDIFMLLIETAIVIAVFPVTNRILIIFYRIIFTKFLFMFSIAAVLLIYETKIFHSTQSAAFLISLNIHAANNFPSSLSSTASNQLTTTHTINMFIVFFLCFNFAHEINT